MSDNEKAAALITLCSGSILIAASLLESKRNRRRWWSTQMYKKRTVSELLRDLKFQHISGQYKNFTRMSPTDFENLLSKIGPQISRKATNPISIQDRLAVTLRFLATGDSYTSLQFLLRISKQSIGQIVCDVCSALVDKLKGNVNTRIVGGEETFVNEFPFMAALILKGKVWCGANIISERFLLTAGHCVLQQRPEDVHILVGDHNLNSGKDTNFSALYKVSAYEIHPKYESKSQRNDIALLQTVTKIIFSPKVGPVCLPFRYTTYDFAGQVVLILGWGQVEFSGPLANALQKAKVTVLTNKACSSMEDSIIIDGEICAHSEYKKDSCQYDSGGPLIWLDTSTSRYILVGLISHGIGCGSANPSINTRVTEYVQWIVQRTAASYCIK